MRFTRRTALLTLAASLPLPAGAATNRVVSPARPTLTLDIAASFRRLPPMAFPIETMTDARREVFVEPGRAGALKRAVIIQFETVKPGSDFRFRYPSRPPQVFGGQTYRSGAYVYDDVRAAEAAPAKEAALTRVHLAAHGYKAPRFWRTARLARVTDADGLTEVIIFYLENADALYPPGPLPGADEDGDLILDEAERTAIFERLTSAIRVVAG